MTDGTIRFRRRRIDNLFRCILMGGLLAATALHNWLHDLLVRSLGPGPDRTVPCVDDGHYRLLTTTSAGGDADR
jgi:hypothetical protein